MQQKSVGTLIWCSPPHLKELKKKKNESVFSLPEHCDCLSLVRDLNQNYLWYNIHVLKNTAILH